MQNCFDLVMNTKQPVIARNQLASTMVFNFLIGNCDAHGKNFSLLHHDAHILSLSPLYDLVSTMYYPSLSANMAMKIGNEYKLERIGLHQWEKLCQIIHYNFSYLKRLIEQQRSDIIELLDKNKDFYVDVTQNPRFVAAFIQKITTRIHTLRMQ